MNRAGGNRVNYCSNCGAKMDGDKKMTVDTEAKIAFLLRYTQMKDRILILLERKRAYEEDIYGLKSPTLSDMPKSSQKSDIGDKVVKLLSVTADIDNEILELTGKMEYVKSVIQRVKNYRYLTVLELKYIDGMQRKQIASMLGGVTLLAVDNLVRRAISVTNITDDDVKRVM